MKDVASASKQIMVDIIAGRPVDLFTFSVLSAESRHFQIFLFFFALFCEFSFRDQMFRMVRRPQVRETNEDSISTFVGSNAAGAILVGSHHRLRGARRHRSCLVCQAALSRENRKVAAGGGGEEST